MSDLKGCPTPWCQTIETPYVWQGADDKYCIICPGCQVEGPACDTEAEASAAWDERQPDEYVVSGSVYESAVKGRQDFRDAYRATLAATRQPDKAVELLREAVGLLKRTSDHLDGGDDFTRDMMAEIENFVSRASAAQGERP